MKAIWASVNFDLFMVLPRPTARITHAAKPEFSSNDRSRKPGAGHNLRYFYWCRARLHVCMRGSLMSIIDTRLTIFPRRECVMVVFLTQRIVSINDLSNCTFVCDKML